MSVSRGDACDRGPARAGVHEDQTIVVAAQKAEGISSHSSDWYVSEPGTLMKLEGLPARAGSVRDADTGEGGSERAGPPRAGRSVQSGRAGSFHPDGPVRSIRTNIVPPGSDPTDLHCGKSGHVRWHAAAALDDCRPVPDVTLEGVMPICYLAEAGSESRADSEVSGAPQRDRASGGRHRSGPGHCDASLSGLASPPPGAAWAWAWPRPGLRRRRPRARTGTRSQ